MTAPTRVEAVPGDGSPSYAVATGIAMFGGIMLAMVGLLQVLQGLSAVLNDDVFTRAPAYVFDFDLAAWGWIHLVIGVISVGVGILIVLRRTWGYSIGVLIAVVSGISTFTFMPYYPAWALVVLAFDMVVIWALCRLMMSLRTRAELEIAHEAAGRRAAAPPIT